jgi:hypothetical protein
LLFSLQFGSSVETLDLLKENFLGLITLELESWGKNVIFRSKGISSEVDLLRDFESEESCLT